MKNLQSTTHETRRAYMGDALILALLLLFCIAMALFLYLPSASQNNENTAVVCVTVAGNPVSRHSLDVPFDGDIGSTGVHLVIADGRAYVSDSDCPDRVCIASGAIDASSPPTKSIVCLPNQVVISLERETKSPAVHQKEVDAIVG